MALRLWPLFDYQFTYDELSGMERTQFGNFSDLIHKGIKIDAHPAFVQVLIFSLVKLFGYTTWVVKLPFLLLSFGALIYGYALGLRNYSKQVGLVMAVILAFSLVFVFYAPIARMYISGVFFSLGLLYHFFEIVFRQNRLKKHYCLFGLFALLSALNQHMNALFAVTVYLGGLLLIEKQGLKPYLLTGLLIIVAYLPNMPITLYQLGVGGIGRDQGGWLEKPALGEVFGFIRILFGTGRLALLIPIIALIAVSLRKEKRFTRESKFLGAVFIVNYLIIYGYSVYRAAIYQHSMMLFSGMAFLLLSASCIRFESRRAFYGVLGFISCLLLFKTYVQKDYLRQAVKTVFEYQFERSFHYKKLYGDKNVCPVFFDVDRVMQRIYFEKYGGRFDCMLSENNILNSMHLYSEFIAGLDCDYIVLTSAMPAQQAVAKAHFPYLLENTQTQGINFKLYSRRAEDKARQVPGDDVLARSNPWEPGDFEYGPKTRYEEGYALDSLNEFPFSAKCNYNDAITKEGNVVLLTGSFRFKTLKGLQLEACISVSNKESGESFGYMSRPASDFVTGSDSVVTLYTDYFAGTTFKKARKGAELGCYLWNRNKEHAVLRDFRIEVIDYWPQKWNFWK